jgi:putative peptidoglycan lipid II flippase
VIVACFLLSSILGVKALVFAQYFSSTVFILLLFVSSRKYHEYFFVKYNEIPELKAIIYTAIPLFIGNSALQINQIVDKSITSGLGEGVASALSYCHTLEQFVTNVMIVNIGNVMFANFAEFVAEERFEDVKSVLSKALNLLIVLLSGISVITIVCSRDIVTIVYFRGNFTKEAVSLTATALVGYAISFVAVAVRDLSIKSLYAFKETKSPMIASIISICINITLSLLLSRYIGILGVSLATSISAIVGMIIISFALKKNLLGYRYSKHFFVFVKCIPGVIVLFAFCCFVEKIILFNALIRFLIASIVGLFIYLCVLVLFKVEGVDEIYALAKSKANKLIRRR